MKRSDITRMLEYATGVAKNGGTKNDIHGSLLTLIKRLQSQPKQNSEVNDLFGYFNKNIYKGK